MTGLCVTWNTMVAIRLEPPGQTLNARGKVWYYRVGQRSHSRSQSRGCCGAVSAVSVASLFSEAQKGEAQVIFFSP